MPKLTNRQKLKRARERLRKSPQYSPEKILEQVKSMAVGAAIGNLVSSVFENGIPQLQIPPSSHTLDLCKQIEAALERGGEFSLETRADVRELIGIARSTIHFPDCLADEEVRLVGLGRDVSPVVRDPPIRAHCSKCNVEVTFPPNYEFSISSVGCSWCGAPPGSIVEES